MGQHDALGGAGGAGGVDEAGDVVGKRAGYGSVAGVGGLAGLDDAQVIGADDYVHAVQYGLRDFGKQPAGDEESLGLGMG